MQKSIDFIRGRNQFSSYFWRVKMSCLALSFPASQGELLKTHAKDSQLYHGGPK